MIREGANFVAIISVYSVLFRKVEAAPGLTVRTWYRVPIIKQKILLRAV
jgi:hypothetical protein